jgi:basic membrane protein A
MNAIKTLISAALVAASFATSATAEDKTFYYISPNPIGVNPFLQMGEIGLRAVAEKHGASATVIESDTPQSRLENVSAAANDGADIVIVLGFEFGDVLSEVAPQFPETQFLIVDQCIDENRPENVSCALFREHEASFLMGVIAGLNTEGNKIGAVAALDIPFLHRFTDAFAAGAKHVNPNVEFDVRWVGGQNPFQDPVRAKELALTLASGGVDIVYAATAGGDFGVFEAASERDFKLMSVDVNHCPAAPGRIYDSALKRVDEVIQISVERILSGDTNFVESYGLKEGGMGAHAIKPDDEIASSECLVADQPEVIAKTREIADMIIDGTLVIDDPMFAN